MLFGNHQPHSLQNKINRAGALLLAVFLVSGTILPARATTPDTLLTVSLKGVSSTDGLSWRSLAISGRFDVKTESGTVLGRVRANPNEAQRAAGESESLAISDTTVGTVLLAPVAEDFSDQFVCRDTVAVVLVPHQNNLATVTAFAQQGLYAVTNTLEGTGAPAVGAEYTVLDSQGNLCQSFVTDENGHYQSQKPLRTGAYQLVQMRSAENSLPDQTPLPFSVTTFFGAPSDIAQITVKSKRAPTAGDQASVALKTMSPFAQERDSDTDSYFSTLEVMPTVTGEDGVTLSEFSVLLMPDCLMDSKGGRQDAQGALVVESVTAHGVQPGFQIRVQGVDSAGMPVGQAVSVPAQQPAVLENAVGAQVTYVNEKTGEALVQAGFQAGSLTATVLYLPLHADVGELGASQAVFTGKVSYRCRFLAADGNTMVESSAESPSQRAIITILDGQVQMSLKASVVGGGQERATLVLELDQLAGDLRDDEMLAAVLPDGVRLEEMEAASGGMRLLRTPQRDVLAFPVASLRQSPLSVPVRAGLLNSLRILAYDPCNLPKVISNPAGNLFVSEKRESAPLLDALLSKLDGQYAELSCALTGSASLPEAEPLDTVILTGMLYEDRDQSGSRTADENAMKNHGVLLRGKQTGISYGTLTDEEGKFTLYAPAAYLDREGTLQTMLPPGGMSVGSHVTGLLQTKVASLPDKNYPMSYIMMGSIEGYIWQGQDAGIAGLQMLLRKGGKTVRSAITDKNGKYIFPTLGVGDYQVLVEIPTDRGVLPMAGEGDTLEGNQLTADLSVAYGQVVSHDFHARALAQYSGVVLQNGQPVPNLDLALTPPGGLPFAATTDQQGRFAFQSIPAGTYQLTLILPQGVGVVEVDGKTVRGKDQFEGNITVAGGDAPSTSILLSKLMSVSGKAPGVPAGETVTAASLAEQISAAVNQDGSFTLENLAAGDYTVYVPLAQGKTLAEGGPWQVTQQGNMVWMPLSLAAGENQHLPDLSFVELTSIEGIAYLDENGNYQCDPDEQLMSGVAVALQKKAGEQWQDLAQTQTDGYGAYRFRDLAPGVYRVGSMAKAEGLYVAAVGNAPRPVGSGGVMISEELAVESGVSLKGKADIAIGQPAALHFAAFADSNESGTRGEYERPISGVLVEVVDESGGVVASGTTDASGEMKLASVRPGTLALRVTLPQGYRFTVKGSGQGLGISCATSEENTAQSAPMAFTAGETVQAGIGAVPVGSFSGRVWSDENNNGIMDQGEPGVSGVLLTLEGVKTKKKFTIATDETGQYKFDRLPNDNYNFSAELPEGLLFAKYSLTGGDLRSVFTVEGTKARRQFPVSGAEDVRNKNVGVIAHGMIKGVAFYDLNYNGIQDEGEPGYKGVTLELIKNSKNEAVGKVVTQEDGVYAFPSLRGGEYRLRAILPEDGSIFSVTPVAEPGALVNRFEQRESRRESTVGTLTIGNGGTATTVVGVARGAVLKGTVFMDNNYDGILKGSEKKVSGVRVELRDLQGNLAASAITNANGNYTLDGVMPGTYLVGFLRKEQHAFSRFRPGEKGGNWVKGLRGDFGATEEIQVTMGQTLEGINAGMLRSSTVAGVFFDDLNDNGLQDPGEMGMQDVKVRLFSKEAEIDLTVPVQADGSYFFDGVMPGKYTLTYLLPEHVELARASQGGNTLKAEGSSPQSEAFQVEMGTENARPLVGAVRLGSFTGHLFHDKNANGVQEDGEESMAGLRLTFTPDQAELEPVTVEAAKDGSFAALGLRPADYQLDMELPEGYIFSADLAVGLALDMAREQQLSCPWNVLIGRQDNAVGMVRPATVKGFIWLDENRDGSQGSQEALLPNLSFELVDEAQGKTVGRATSGQDGSLVFENVRPGTYTLRFAMPGQAEPAGEKEATFHQQGHEMRQSGIVLTESQTFDQVHAGLVCRTSIAGVVALDENGETHGLGGLTVQLFLEGNPEALQTTATSADGRYRFDGLWPGNYTIICQQPKDMIFLRQDDPNYKPGTSVVTSQSQDMGSSDPFALQMARHMTRQDVRFIRPAKLGDLAWLDSNQNGLLDGGEPTIPGLTVQLMDGDTVVAETITNAYGYYLLENIYPGTYRLRVKGYEELDITRPVPELRLISSCLTSGDGQQADSDAFSLVSGSVNLDFDLGYVLREGQPMPAAIAPPPGKDWTGAYVSGGKQQ